ncbi:Oxidoreductase, short-chain dehydrogenase/reductase family [Pseudoalteromonas luteoviolacea B = ATCC 29581]|nr:Oxidoreductase, short-chain dehydrogenase/reductase family [Pseudoalteromonas luteoviolacea B = ATCC 29581]
MKVLITGASSGIGRSLAQLLANNNEVIACGRNQAALKDLSTNRNIVSLNFDVSVKADVEQVSHTLPSLDWVILNAGTCEYINDPWHFDSALFERVIRTNLLSVGYCLEFIVPKIKRGGKLVLVSSSATILPLPRAEAYGTSKAALTYLGETLAITRPDIDVVIVHPGFVKTPLTDKNDFPMPFLLDSEDAASRIVAGLNRNIKRIEFPKRLIYIMKIISILPNSLWASLARRMKK